MNIWHSGFVRFNVMEDKIKEQTIDHTAEKSEFWEKK